MLSSISVLEDFNFGRADEDSIELVGKVQLKKYSNFVSTFSTGLQQFSEIFKASSLSTKQPLIGQALEICPFENITLTQLVTSENRVFGKIMLVLTSLCSEMQELRVEGSALLDALLFYGESRISPAEALKSGEAQMEMSRLLGTLHQLSTFVSHSTDVVRLVIQQLSAVYGGLRKAPSNVPLIDSTDLHLLTVFEELVDLFTLLMNFDSVIAGHAVLEDHWNSYRRTLSSAMQNPTKVGIEIERLRPFERYMMRLKGQLLDAVIMQVCIEQEYDTDEVFVSKNQKFAKELNFVTKRLAEMLLERIGESNETDQRSKFIGICGLLLLQQHLFRQLDKKTVKTVWGIHKKLPLIWVRGMYFFHPTKYLLSKIPAVSKLLSSSEIQAGTADTLVATYLATKESSIDKTVAYCELLTTNWLVEVKKLKLTLPRGRQDGVETALTKLSDTLINGLLHLSVMSHYLQTMLTAYVATNRRATKSTVLQLCRLVELIKAVEAAFDERALGIAVVVPFVIQRLTYNLAAVLRTTRREFTGSVSAKSSIDMRKADGIAALQMAEEMACGPLTQQRLLVIKISLNCAFKFGCFTDEHLNSVQSVVQQLSLLTPLFKNVRFYGSLDLLYWHRHGLLTAYLRQAYDTTNAFNASRVPFFIAGLQDAFVPIARARHLTDPTELAEFYFDDIFDILKGELLNRLCTDIENDLRIQTHLHLKLDDRNPFKIGVKDLKAFIDLPPIPLYDRSINVKVYVEQHLDRIFYDLTAVALHDWQTYGRMRMLARARYGLELIESYLPSQTLEQGTDALFIMRDIDAFTDTYYYNLNNQVFLEKRSKNSFFNTVNIRHVANSIRTHGTGIMNTMVNYCYQFLRHRLAAYAQFLIDENIKSRLMKDIRYFRENHWNKDQRYPFERADKFNKGIRKLGVDQGLSYLDKFRHLITQLGNALGFVRMIRSGGLHCISQAVRFIPDQANLPNFAQLAEAEFANSPRVLESARNLASVIDSQSHSFGFCVDYFRLLIDAFSPEVRDPKKLHFKNFYIIVPPLMVNFVEYMLASKERLNRKNTEGATFTDDGFAMGVAYLLTMLDQWDDYDALHWVQSVRNKHINEKKQAETQLQSTGATDDKLRQTLQLTLARLGNYTHEFELLVCTLTSARNVFRSGSEPAAATALPVAEPTPAPT